MDMGGRTGSRVGVHECVAHERIAHECVAHGRGSRSDEPRARRAFTLVEMVVVMTIIGIIGLVVLPSFFNSTANTVNAVTSPVEDVLRAAQRAAADSGRTVHLTLDPSSGQYLATMDGLDAPLANGTLALGGGTSVATDSIRARFVFQPSGASYGDSLQVRGGGQYAIVSVDPWTGSPRVRTW